MNNIAFAKIAANRQFFFQVKIIKDIHVKNYCGVTDLKISDCKRINLLVGKNGVGKTTILEYIETNQTDRSIKQFFLVQEYNKDVSDYRDFKRLERKLILLKKTRLGYLKLQNAATKL